MVTIFAISFVQSFVQGQVMLFNNQTQSQTESSFWNMMMHNVANAPVSLYFDVTPVSRIVQAFTIDLKQIDSFVVEQSQSLINQVYFICGLIVMTWLHVPTLLPVMMLMAFRSFFKATENDTPNREINRLQRSV